ncbi:MAG TPA: aldehyde dehydrogenase family protein [Aestuariivirgaceae bacterium]|nr:aldehyde dehydrogenase family protein [Aestuariivirgaceae bacterium]
MDPAIQSLVDISTAPASLKARAEMMLERARWAAEVFQRYDRGRTYAIAEAVAKAAHAKAGEYAEWAVRETGFGVAAHKKLKNEQTSTHLVAHYRDWDFVNPRLDAAAKIVEMPRPAGVIFALTPSTNPVSTVYFKALIALMTRNAIVISPHPAARACCVDAVRTLSEAAAAAGAPEAVLQVVDNPSIPLIDQFMQSPKTDLILATGGTAMVRAAYSSSNPALGVGPGNAPVYVDASADLKEAARSIVDSKSFDNSVLCTNESVLITTEAVERALRKELEKAGCHVCSEAETQALRRYLFHERGFNVEAIGRDAAWIAGEAGFKVAGKVKVLLAPIALIGVDEPLSREKLCPVLGFYVATSKAQALAQARGLLRLAGAGHSAAIHCSDPRTVIDYSAAAEVYRVVVNAPCSQAAAGIGTNLAPTYTVGTGFFGRSALGENLGPQHLVHWTRVAWPKDGAPAIEAAALSGLAHPGPLPEAPSDGVPGKTRVKLATPRPAAQGGSYHELREEIRRIIAEELRAVLKE